MTNLLRVALLITTMAACFTRPELKSRDGGADDGGTGDGNDSGCTVAMEPPTPPLNQLSFDHVATGVFHACAIDTAGDLWCWGSNDHGQLGARTDSPGLQTGRPGRASPTITGWTAVSASSDHSCGIANDKVYCWGRNEDHQSIPGGTGNDIVPTEVSFANIVFMPNEVPRRIYAGPTASCTITSTDRAICWGDIDLGLATSATPTPELLVTLDANDQWSTLAIGASHACGLSLGGQIYCWGVNSRNQLGDATTTDRLFGATPPRDTMEAFTSISVGPQVTCATRTNGDLVCFGSTGAGHLGDVGAVTQDDDHLVTTGAVDRVSVGLNHVCAATTSNDVYCYGDNFDGALGGGSLRGNRDLAGVVMGNVAELSVGEGFSCALDTAKHLSCWGSNAHGELGLGVVATKRAPSTSLVPLGSCEAVRQIAAGDRHTCAIVVETQATVSGRLYCWGNNEYRQVTGISMELSIPRPVELFPGEAFSRVTAGERHTCALRADGVIRCWGDNGDGQLGQPGSSPTLIPPIDNMAWSYVAAGSRATCAIRVSGELFCWGTVPTIGMSSTPTNFGRPTEGGAKNWMTIALGSGFGIGTAIDAALPDQIFVYGFAATGCQVDTDPTMAGAMISNPQLLHDEPHVSVNVAAAQAGGAHVCMHMQLPTGTNKITCLGRNFEHQCSPVATAPTACVSYEDTAMPPSGWRMPFQNVSTVTVSRSHSCALDAIGRPRCWGANSASELGNLPGDNTMPTQVTEQRFVELSTGADHTCGIIEPRTGVACWGENRYGQLGDDARFHAVPTPAGLVSP